MMALLAPFLSRAWAWLAAAGAALAALAGALAAARASGRQAERGDAAMTEVHTAQEAKNVQDQVAASSADDRRNRLREWSSGS